MLSVSDASLTFDSNYEILLEFKEGSKGTWLYYKACKMNQLSNLIYVILKCILFWGIIYVFVHKNVSSFVCPLKNNCTKWHQIKWARKTKVKDIIVVVCLQRDGHCLHVYSIAKDIDI